MPPLVDPPKNVLTEPVFSALTRAGAGHLSLPGLLEAVDNGDLIDLTGMRAHQRGAVVTTLAIIRTVLRRYMDDSDPHAGFAAADYEEAWRSQVGEDAARICAPQGEVAFLQPPLLAEAHLTKSLDAADVMFSDVRHEMKGAGDTGDAETWLYAIMSGMLRIYVKDNVSGSRWGNTLILPGDGVTIGSEILHLSQAYQAMAKTEAVRDMFPKDGQSAADHLIFLQPLKPDTKPLSPLSLPYPFIEAARALRLFETEVPGVYCARQMTLAAPRIDVKPINENLIDPHIPISKGKPYRLIKGRRFGHRFVSTVLFAPSGGDVEQIPHTLLSPMKAIRICALRTDQGKTTGYYEQLLRIKKQKLRVGLCRKEAADRLSLLAEYGLRASADIQKVVFAAASMMYGESTDISAAAAGSAADVFRAAMDEQLPLWVLDRAGEPASDLDGDKASFAAIAVPAANQAVQSADRAAATSSPLFKARAWSYLDFALYRNPTMKGYDLVTAKASTAVQPPQLVIRVGGIMGSIAGRIKADPDVTKVLRTMSISTRPIAYWRLAQEMPADLLQSQDGIAAVDVILKGVGDIEHVNGTNDAPGRFSGFGAILARADFPEMRMDRLITANGETLRRLADEAWRFASAKGEDKADWRTLAGLLIADALHDLAAVDWYRRQMALAYVREAAAADKKRVAA